MSLNNQRTTQSGNERVTGAITLSDREIVLEAISWGATVTSA